MTLLTAPPWIQVVLVAEGAALAWLTWRFGWRGLLAGLAAGLASWFLLGLAASYLVGRLEGGRAASAAAVFSGAMLGAGRAAMAALPLLAAGAVAGLGVRAALRRNLRGG